MAASNLAIFHNTEGLLIERASDLERMLAPSARSHFYRLIRRAAAFERATEHGATQAIRTAHYHGFLRWLCLRLEQQVNDIDEVVAVQTVHSRTAFLQWLSSGERRILIPRCALASERELFMTDLQLVLELLCNEFRDE